MQTVNTVYKRSMMPKKINFILSGPGLIGRQHAKLINQNSNTHLAVIVAPSDIENEKFCHDMGAKFYTDFEQALKNEQIDAAIISSPNKFHFAQAMMCIKKGIPVLIEKPLTDNIDESFELYNQAQNLNVPVLVGHHRTYNPLLEPVKQFLQSDKFGRLVIFSGHALFYKPAHYFVEGEWRTKKGGGPILINLIHEIGLMRYLCGEISSVFAIARNNIRGYEVEDTVVITLVFKNGALGNFVLSDAAASNKSWELTTGENPAYPQSQDANSYHFAGTKGSVDFPTMKARYYSDGTDPSWWTDFTIKQLFRPQGNSLALQLEHFIDVINGKVKPIVTALDGHMNLVVVDAIMQSIEKGVMVDVAANKQ